VKNPLSVVRKKPAKYVFLNYYKIIRTNLGLAHSRPKNMKFFTPKGQPPPK